MHIRHWEICNMITKVYLTRCLEAVQFNYNKHASQDKIGQDKGTACTNEYVLKCTALAHIH